MTVAYTDGAETPLAPAKVKSENGTCQRLDRIN